MRITYTLTSTLLPLSYFFLSLAIYIGNGMYETRGFYALAVSYALLLLWSVRVRNKRSSTTPIPMLLLCVAAILITGTLHRPWYYADFSDPMVQQFISFFVLLILIPLWYKYRAVRSKQVIVFLGAVLFALCLHVWMMLASSPPLIDVYVTLQESAAALLEGKNPYLISISNPHPNGINYGYTITGYMTFPPTSTSMSWASHLVVMHVGSTSLRHSCSPDVSGGLQVSISLLPLQIFSSCSFSSIHESSSS